MKNLPECPQCGIVGEPLYRTRPKGQRAIFVCEECLRMFPDAPKPDERTTEISETIMPASRVLDAMKKAKGKN